VIRDAGIADLVRSTFGEILIDALGDNHCRLSVLGPPWICRLAMAD
jgi:hypothetical protein